MRPDCCGPVINKAHIPERPLKGLGMFEIDMNRNMRILLRDGTQSTAEVLLMPGDSLEITDDEGVSMILQYDRVKPPKKCWCCGK